MNRDPDCLFCKIVAGDIPSDQVYSDDKVIVFKDINPKAPVHLLIVPREHIASLNELEDQHKDLISHMMMLLPKLAKDHNLKGYRTVINTGREGGQVVFHLHIHLLGGQQFSD